ncbi:MAG: hypothetical protein KGH57_04065 [Candidatus Micrarchaeota archaeon]|nr:hypothetical protein [Candidatus Micrarchaeota archaeon]
MGINSAKYLGINSNWTNVEFTTGPGGTGQPLQAWVESGPSNTSGTRVWVRLNQSISAFGSRTIYMDIMPNNVMSANGPTGEAPTLSSVYGKYDNGNRVFNIYDNFTGRYSGNGTGAIDSQVSSGSNGTAWKVDNGLTFGQGVPYEYSPACLGNCEAVVYLSHFLINRSSYFSLNQTVDVNWGPSSEQFCLDIYCYGHYTVPTGYGGFVSSNDYSFDSGVLETNPARYGTNPDFTYSMYTYNGNAEVSQTFNFSAFNSLYNEYFYFTDDFAKPGMPLSFSLYNSRFYLESRYAGYDFGPPLNSSTSLNSPSDAFAMIAYSYTDNYGRYVNNTATINWIRARNTPPNGIMPAVSFGPLQ